MDIRKAVFSGKFYPSSPQELEKLIDRISNKESNKIEFALSEKQIIGAIVPHAGYIYSGHQAIHPFEIIKASTQVFDTIVIINPNHTGQGKGQANQANYSEWETPLGNLATDTLFSDFLDIHYSNKAHENEHSCEVILPLLKHYLSFNFKVVPITMNIQTQETAKRLAKKIHQASVHLNKKTLVLASSDFSHFETADIGFKKDQYLIDQIIQLNSEGLFQQVKHHQVSACGYGPMMTLIEYAKLAVSSPSMKLLSRGHSGEVHPSPQVVDYASFLCFE